MKKKLIVTSILSMVMCVSLIIGATFALFTSEDNVNIAVTSGKVNVTAHIDENSVQTKQLYTEYQNGANGLYEGVATFTEEGLTLVNLVPGDAIRFNIIVKNNSNVTVKFRSAISCVNNNGLFEGLNVSIADRENYNGVTYVTNWELMYAGSADIIVPVVIELPEDAGNVYQEKTGNDVTFALYDLDGNQLHKKNSTKTVTGSYTPTKTGWVAMKVWNTVNTNAGQKCWVNVAYQAPATVTGTMSDRADTRASIWTGNAGTSTWTDCGNWEQGKVPNASSIVVIPDNGDVKPVVTGDVTIAKLIIEKGKGNADAPDVKVNGKLTVTSSECKNGTAFVCGKGKIKLGSQTGEFDTCPPVVTDVYQEYYADLSIFPNPATSVLYIQSGELPVGDAYIYNISGKLCKTVTLQGKEITEVEVADLPAGVYILRLESQTLRFIKK